MDCYCYSHKLYSQQTNQPFVVDGKKINPQRKIPKEGILNEQKKSISDSIMENSSIYLSTIIEKVDIHEVYENPLWFYKSFLAANRPCIITGVTEGKQISQKWSNPSDFKKISQEKISISLTPDGFADSVKDQYFIEPYTTKGKISSVIDWADKDKEKAEISQNLIPYIQHQNSNLTTQLSVLQEGINQQTMGWLSKNYFDKGPDAQNFWMGYKDSVSALHKDPYENFYTVITGEKHFTLLPPISILSLSEGNYINGKWSMNDGNLEVITKDEKKSYLETRWIANNPDLKADYDLFEEMQKIENLSIHTIVEAGQMLYLPSLWYHQVAQAHPHSPYLIAINYWFDMEFNQNYTLYQTCRKLKGYYI